MEVLRQVTRHNEPFSPFESPVMKSAHVVIILLTLFLSAVLFGNTSSWADDTPPQVEQLIQKKTYVKAIHRLRQILEAHPDDTQARLQLGTCYVRTGYYAQAHQLFSAVINTDASLREQVALIYLDEGAEKLMAGHTRKARILLEKAVKWQPELRKTAAAEAFRQGERLFYAGKHDAADERFSVANSLDDAYGRRICDIYFEHGNALGGTACLEYYRVAAWYCRSHNEAIGLRLLRMAKTHSSKEIIEIFKAEAARYVSADTIESVFPSPAWKTIETRSYIGKGVGPTNDRRFHLATVRFGETVHRGDKLVVEADGAFKIWDAGWEKHESHCELIVTNPIAGDYFYVQGKKDRRLIVTVQRYQ
jgi:hypothetical protein